MRIPATPSLPAFESKHYDENYFKWQNQMGVIGGKIDSFKFIDEMNSSYALAEIGCGGGYMLMELPASSKIGVDINPAARENAFRLGLQVHPDTNAIASESVDRVISHHALEHIVNPFHTVQEMFRILRPGGISIIVVPCEGPDSNYSDTDVNQHLFTWNQATLGNLFKLAGFHIVASQAIQHQWPDNYASAFSSMPPDQFHGLCLREAVRNRNFQIRLMAAKPPYNAQHRNVNPILGKSLYSPVV